MDDTTVVEETPEEVIEEVANVVDYSQQLEDIKILLINIDTSLTDIFNLIFDFSVLGVTLMIGLVSINALWKEGLKW